jgi:uncharacterized protein YjbI with pentapeptide repeats
MQNFPKFPRIINNLNYGTIKQPIRPTPKDFSNQDLTDKDLTRANLTRANLTRANLTRANLTRANLTLANLTRANLTLANLTRANLTDANLTGGNLTRADLTDANLTRAIFMGPNLTGANLTRADLTDANLTAFFTTIDFNDLIFSGQLKITASLSLGGSPFQEVVPNIISIYGGDIVDSIVINNNRFGGGGGSQSQIITLSDNEYINEVAYSFESTFSFGNVCSYLEFKTSLGTIINRGNRNSQWIQRLKNIRLISISGRYGSFVDNLTFICDKINR